MKKLAQFAVMSLMLTAVFSSINTPAVAGVNSLIGLSPAPMPLCDPNDKTCKHPFWPNAQANLSPAPMPLCDPNDKTCKHPFWPN